MKKAIVLSIILGSFSLIVFSIYCKGYSDGENHIKNDINKATIETSKEFQLIDKEAKKDAPNDYDNFDFLNGYNLCKN